MTCLAVKNLLLISSTAAMVAACAVSPVLTNGRSQERPHTAQKDQVNRDLHRVAEGLVKAVMERDIQTLLSYDRPDLREQDAITLTNVKSSLYCYIFDSSCIEGSTGDWRSVYDKLKGARHLGIKVEVSRSSLDNKIYGTMTFYDRLSVSDKNLKSLGFFCKEYPAQIASWSFTLEEGKWKAATPFFNYGTEYCDEPL
jgi:hypothetical protein